MVEKWPGHPDVVAPDVLPWGTASPTSTRPVRSTSGRLGQVCVGVNDVMALEQLRRTTSPPVSPFSRVPPVTPSALPNRRTGVLARRTISGPYLDGLERRDGQSLTARRRSTIELVCTSDPGSTASHHSSGQGHGGPARGSLITRSNGSVPRDSGSRIRQESDLEPGANVPGSGGCRAGHRKVL